jgi:hypothetical protein
LAEFLMALASSNTYDGALGPFVARCIPPLPPVLDRLAALQESYLKIYADRVVKLHLQTALVAVACGQPACSTCSTCVLDLQDPTTGESQLVCPSTAVTCIAAGRGT